MAKAKPVRPVKRIAFVVEVNHPQNMTTQNVRTSIATAIGAYCYFNTEAKVTPLPRRKP